MRIDLDLAPQVLDVGVHCAVEGVAVVAVDGVEQLRPREDAPRLPHQRRQQRELRRGHLDGARKG